MEVHTTMLKASQNKNVLSCRLKAAWDDVLRTVPRSMLTDYCFTVSRFDDRMVQTKIWFINFCYV